MTFSQNWFKELNGENNFNSLPNILDFNKAIKYLEIGVFEGNAHLHMYSQLFKNQESKSIAIDPFGGGTGNSTHPDAEHLFRANLSEYLDKITIIKNISDNVLPNINENDFDIIYIDGDHTGDAVYKDAKNCWNLLKKEGVMIFDDYLWHGFRHSNPKILAENAIGEVHHPAVGINKFLKEHNNEYKLLGKEQGLTHDCKILNLDPELIKLYNDETIRLNYNYQILIQKL